MFEPIRTDRLVLRPMRPEDAESLHRRRNDPEVAEFQSWELPVPRQRIEEMLSRIVAMDGPVADEWWMATIADAGTDDVYGDLALLLSNGGRTAEVGFTLASQHWGNGYAAEAVAGLVGYLFESGVVRIEGRLHPDNRASAMVLERNGFVFEGHTRKSYWVGDEVSDDWIYGLISEDWEAWQERSRTAPTDVKLVEVTGENLGAVYDSKTHKTQESFVAPNPRSLVEAHIPGDHDGHAVDAWHRAIEADGEIVGFVMVALIDDPEEEPFLWRLLIDRMHQRRGIAGTALDLVEDHVRSLGEKALLTSWVPGRGSPEPFYRRRGFVPTGEMEGIEVVARKEL